MGDSDPVFVGKVRGLDECQFQVVVHWPSVETGVIEGFPGTGIKLHAPAVQCALWYVVLVHLFDLCAVQLNSLSEWAVVINRKVFILPLHLVISNRII